MLGLVLCGALALAALAACGGSSGDTAAPEPPPEDTGVIVEDVERIVEEPSEPTESGFSDPGAASEEPAPEVSLLDFLLETPGEDVAIIPGGSDYFVGDNRVSFLVLRSDASQVLTPDADVLVGKVDVDLPDVGEADEFGNIAGLDVQIDASTIDATPIATSSASLITIGTEEGRVAEAGDASQIIDIEQLYVTDLTFDEEGVYWIVVEPDGEEVQAFGILQVRDEALVPAVGEPAIPSDNPTLDDAHARDITTLSPPALELLRYSIEDSVEDGVPFVVTFATPEFCVSRVCGPVVDVVDEVRVEFEDTDVRFIQVEIYQENNPGLGVNEWVGEWMLNSEPWTFLVGPDGVITGRFEGAFSADELREAVQAQLIG